MFTGGLAAWLWVAIVQVWRAFWGICGRMVSQGLSRVARGSIVEVCMWPVLAYSSSLDHACRSLDRHLARLERHICGRSGPNSAQIGLDSANLGGDSGRPMYPTTLASESTKVREFDPCSADIDQHEAVQTGICRNSLELFWA